MLFAFHPDTSWYCSLQTSMLAGKCLGLSMISEETILGQNQKQFSDHTTGSDGGK